MPDEQLDAVSGGLSCPTEMEHAEAARRLAEEDVVEWAGETLAGEPDLEDAWKPIGEVPGSPADDAPPADARDKRTRERT